MKKKIIKLLLAMTILTTILVGCESTSDNETVDNIQENSSQSIIEEKKEDIKDKEIEASEYYETGKSYLYGINGKKVDYELAYDNFEKALELGNIDANYYLGLLYDYYSYPEKNDVIAKSYYEASETPYAQIMLGYMYVDGRGVEKDIEKGREKFERAISEGFIEGYSGLAYLAYNEEEYTTSLENYVKVAEEGTELSFTREAMEWNAYFYEEGIGVAQDINQAIEWYEKMAAAGESNAYAYIGMMYLKGNAVEMDYIKAIEYFEKGALNGNIHCMENMGYMYREGLGVDADAEKSIEWYEKAAIEGNGDGYNYIGLMYSYGTLVEQDYKKALEYYERGAAVGNIDAIENVALYYREGLGVEVDIIKAVELYEQAIEKGSIESLVELGNMYREGKGVEQDYNKAIEYYKKGVELEDPACLIWLGCMYRDGNGVDAQWEKAVEYFEKAGDLGEPTGYYFIGQIYEYGIAGAEFDYRLAKPWYDKAEEMGYNP